jgi:hypothetical protein
LILFLAWGVLALIPSGALALSARDLILVYNRNMPESRDVAGYYAQKRQVPPENLVGVNVPNSEDISRNNYDHKLVPPVKAMVDRLNARHFTILLIYGISEVGTTPHNSGNGVKDSGRRQGRSHQVEALQLVQNWTGIWCPGPAPRLIYPPWNFSRNPGIFAEARFLAAGHLAEKPVEVTDLMITWGTSELTSGERPSVYSAKTQ